MYYQVLHINLSRFHMISKWWQWLEREDLVVFALMLIKSHSSAQVKKVTQARV